METIKNDLTKLKAVQGKFGGPVKAARAANVSYVTWYRWMNNQRAVMPQVEKLLDLLLAEQTVANQ